MGLTRFGCVLVLPVCELFWRRFRRCFGGFSLRQVAACKGVEAAWH